MGCVSSSTAVTKSPQPLQNPPPAPSSSNDPLPPSMPPVKSADINQSSVNNSSPIGTVSPKQTTSQPVQFQTACFGAGCYWGTEKFIRHKFVEQFGHLGSIINGQVGFMGTVDAPANPTYREVCSGSTGHVEVYQFQYTGGAPQFEALVRFFFQFHDPTTKNRQGNDKGTQYSSVIYCFSEEQLRIASQVKDELQALIDCGKLKPFSMKVVETEIRESTTFYPAHEEHQDYLRINPNGYCNHRIRFKEWPKLEF